LETLNIKLDLEIITHDQVTEHPYVNISINGFPQFGKVCEQDTLVDIDIEVEDNKEYFLTVEFQNKDPKTDVVLDSDKNPIKDKRVNIRSVQFDDIEISYFDLLPENTFVYEPTDPMGVQATGFEATKLAWNGKTTLRFTTPIYIWLLENL